MTIFNQLYELVQQAVEDFWETRNTQLQQQKATGVLDAGLRGAVTGGKQMSSFEHLAINICLEKGISRNSICCSTGLNLPGYFRPEKKWDLLIVDNNVLVAAIEFKSQVGPSFGNNFNNRTEEAIGTAQDLWLAYREGIFGEQIRPWLGYFFVLEEHPKSSCPVKLQETHFRTFEEFRDDSYTSTNKKGVSYAKRYEIFFTKLIRERYYDACCLLLSPYAKPITFKEPSKVLSANRFFAQLVGHLEAYITAKNI